VKLRAAMPKVRLNVVMLTLPLRIQSVS